MATPFVFLPDERIREIHDAAIAAGFQASRDALLAQVSRSFVTGLQTAASPRDQLLLDLTRLNRTERLKDGSVPFEQWLSVAVGMAQEEGPHAIFHAALEAVRARIAQMPATRVASPDTPGKPGASPRKHFLDEIPFDFSRPESKALSQVLEENIDEKAVVKVLLDTAGVRRGNIDLDQPPRIRWANALKGAAAQGKTRVLVETIARDPDWAGIRPRLVELLGASPPVDPGAGNVAWKGPPVLSGEERTAGARATWVDVAFLQTGMQRAKAVVRVDADFDGVTFMGTGFFIAPGRVLTNHHVLFRDGRPADKVMLWVSYEASEDGVSPSLQTIVIEQPRIQGGQEHDWATLEVDDARVAGVPWLHLGGKRAPRPGEFVSIIQHPHGLPKKLGIFRNEVQHVDAEHVQYLTDTAAGSSGSPVFNERWEVVALHHRWTLAPADAAQPVKPGVQMAVPPPLRSAGAAAGSPVFYNQGVRIERVIEDLRSRSLLPPPAGA